MVLAAWTSPHTSQRHRNSHTAPARSLMIGNDRSPIDTRAKRDVVVSMDKASHNRSSIISIVGLFRALTRYKDPTSQWHNTRAHCRRNGVIETHFGEPWATASGLDCGSILGIERRINRHFNMAQAWHHARSTPLPLQQYLLYHMYVPCQWLVSKGNRRTKTTQNNIGTCPSPILSF
jgi:hypothetical protein